MRKPGELQKPVKAGELRKDLTELCSCPGVCLVHGVPKFRRLCTCPDERCTIHGLQLRGTPQRKPKGDDGPSDITEAQLAEWLRSQGKG